MSESANGGSGQGAGVADTSGQSMEAFFASLFGPSATTTTTTAPPAAAAAAATTKAAGRGRAGSRLTTARPHSARPATATPAPAPAVVSSSGYGVGGVSLHAPKSPRERVSEALRTLVPTPSHLHRLKLHQARSLVTPKVSSAQISNLSGFDGLCEEDQAEALRDGLRKKMSLLEGERRAVQERAQWQIQQATIQLEELTREGRQLQGQLEEKRRMAEAERLAIETRKRQRLKNPDPLATAASMRARASTGHGLKPESLFNANGAATTAGPTAPMAPSTALVRRPASARTVRGVSTTATVYDPHTARSSSSAIAGVSTTTSPIPSPGVVTTGALDPFRALKFRKAFDLLRHAAEGKQKQYDALAKDLESMILKVKSAEGGGNTGAGVGAAAGGRVSGEKRSTTHSDFNPFVLQLQQHLARLGEVALSTNDAARVQVDLARELHQLQKDHAFFTRTLQAAEQQLKAKEIDLQNTINLCAHAREAARDAQVEQRKLYGRLTELADQREDDLEAKENEKDELKAFFEDNAAREREKRGDQAASASSRATSRRPSHRAANPTQTATSGQPAIAGDPAAAMPIALLMPGDAEATSTTKPMSPRAHGPSRHLTALVLPSSNGGHSSHDRDTKLIVALPRSNSDQGEEEEFLQTLPDQRTRTIVRGFLALEARWTKTATGSTSPSSAAAASAGPSSDINSLVHLALQRVRAAEKLRLVLEQKRVRREQLEKELEREKARWERARERLDDDDVQATSSSTVGTKDSAFLTQTTIDEEQEAEEEEKQPYRDDALDWRSGVTTLSERSSTGTRSLVAVEGRLVAANADALARADLFARKQARLDSVLAAARTCTRNLYDLLEDATKQPLSAVAPDGGAHPSRRNSLAPAAGGADSRRGSSAGQPHPSAQTRNRASSVDFGAGGVAGVGAGAPGLSEKKAAGTPDSLLLATLVGVHAKLVEIADAIPPTVLPLHLATIATALHTTEPLFPEASDDEAVATGAAAASGTIREEGEEEDQEEEPFEVQHSPIDSQGE